MDSPSPADLLLQAKVSEMQEEIRWHQQHSGTGPPKTQPLSPAALPPAMGVNRQSQVHRQDKLPPYQVTKAEKGDTGKRPRYKFTFGSHTVETMQI